VPPAGILLRFVLLASTDPDALVASYRVTPTGRVWEILALNADHLTWVRGENASTSEWSLESEPPSEEGAVIEAWARPRTHVQAVRLLAAEATEVRESHEDTTFTAHFGFTITFADTTSVSWPCAQATSESEELLRGLLHGVPAASVEVEGD
jgi:hypothetical protein